MLLKSVYLDALRTREQKISRLKDSNYEAIAREANASWNRYMPIPCQCQSAGVDSSWNKRAYQGLNLYVIDAVAVSSTNDIIASEYDDDISESARNESLEAKAMGMEASVTRSASETGKVDVVCVDGSIIARLNKKAAGATFDEAKKYSGSVFVAKSSESRAQFGPLGSRAGDIFYYNRVSNSSAGYSTPSGISTPYGRITEVYARLRENTPMIRLEFLGETGDSEVTAMLDRLCYHSVAGYPYCLKLAHNTCKISDEDIDRIASIFSLQNEHGARDALNE
ncbi:MAG TPA: DNA double-strand break repair nuclease NurA [Nitrososphaera sp.]|nr:DNA double-strand break repair nuclease NurA [Nitrososphaera sp.]